MGRLIIRKAIRDDITDILSVESTSFNEPWPEDIFYQEIVNNAYANYFVATLNSKVIGYAGLWVVIDDAQITNIAIHSDYRGKGYGEQLFQFMLHQALMLGAQRLSLEVRVSNLAAQRLYEKYGLVPGGIRKKYYTDNQEDAIVMWVNL
ncbi:MAG TPA: ribosomal protein S18-alanine N-acetyltransferase [Bacillota bacterium]|nr:ribosomal protein S18-alanine N-acetyltransferase [Bacillota bacterium]